MTDRLPFLLRPAVADDAPFILDSWTMDARMPGRSAHDMPEAERAAFRTALKAFRADQRWLVGQLLSKCAVLVACLEDDDSVIVGYAVTCGNIVAHAHVKKDFRRLGIAKAMLAPYAGRSDVLLGSRPLQAITLPDGWRFSHTAYARILAS